MFYEVYEGLKEPLFETGARRESVLSVMDIEAYNRQENLALSLAEVQHLQALSRRFGKTAHRFGSVWVFTSKFRALSPQDF